MMIDSIIIIPPTAGALTLSNIQADVERKIIYRNGHVFYCLTPTKNT
jgi:hypothetical protein